MECSRVTKSMDQITQELTGLRDSHSNMYQILAEKDSQLDAVMQENRKHATALEEKHRQAKIQVGQRTNLCMCVYNTYIKNADNERMRARTQRHIS